MNCHRCFNLGLTTYYSNGTTFTHGCNDDKQPTVKRYHFCLTSDERIKMVKVGYESCIRGISFTTNQNRTLGPYGDLEPNMATSGANDHSTLHYLAALGGSVHSSMAEMDVVSQLALIWGE